MRRGIPVSSERAVASGMDPRTTPATLSGRMPASFILSAIVFAMTERTSGLVLAFLMSM